jgi:phosphate-selective porin OprO/OprP
MMANYGRAQYSDAAIAAGGGDRDYSVDAFGMRAQLDF